MLECACKKRLSFLGFYIAGDITEKAFMEGWFKQGLWFYLRWRVVYHRQEKDLILSAGNKCLSPGPEPMLWK
jgi:hypothetical protein